MGDKLYIDKFDVNMMKTWVNSNPSLFYIKQVIHQEKMYFVKVYTLKRYF